MASLLENSSKHVSSNMAADMSKYMDSAYSTDEDITVKSGQAWLLSSENGTNAPIRIRIQFAYNSLEFHTPQPINKVNNSGLQAWLLNDEGKCVPIRTQVCLSPNSSHMQIADPENILEKIEIDIKSLRMVAVKRDPVTGLGLTIKGGAENNLPVIISQVIPGQAAHCTGNLLVGDGIIKVNGVSILHCTHSEATEILRNAGELVFLTVKHYENAKKYLQASKKNGKVDVNQELDESCSSNSSTDLDCSGSGAGSSFGPGSSSSSSRKSSAIGNDMKSIEYNNQVAKLDAFFHNLPETHEMVTIAKVDLNMAYLSRHDRKTGELRPFGFELQDARKNAKSWVITFDTRGLQTSWANLIEINIRRLIDAEIRMYNQYCVEGERVEFMGWLTEIVPPTEGAECTYKKFFMGIKGTSVYTFEVPPKKLEDWELCTDVCKIYFSSLRIVSDRESLNDRLFSFWFNRGRRSEGTKYVSVENCQDYLRLKSSWENASTLACNQVKKVTFAVKGNNKLHIDINYGYSLEGKEGRDRLWNFSFNQLKDIKEKNNILEFKFQKRNLVKKVDVLEMKEVECKESSALLHCMIAFMHAKLCSEDKVRWLKNLATG